MDYQNMGVFDRIAGLLLGRPMRYTEDQRRQWHALLHERLAGYDFPVIIDMDFGHTSPMFTIPIGCRATIDVPDQCFAIIESAVR